MDPKFRAWDKRFSEFVEDFFVSEDGKIYKKTKDTSYGFAISRETSDKIILMQSTGLKDKNGKEIFEGDVLEIQDIKMIVRFGSYNYIETSKSGNHTLGIMCDGLGFYVECLNVAAPDRISPFEPETLKESAVIGNIYENKDILEASDDQ
jgi:uncharacterized phage protein (TIGR01671 family)